MALQACHECGHQVSSEATACPSCGAPVPRPMMLPGEYLHRITGNPNPTSEQIQSAGRLWKLGGWTVAWFAVGATVIAIAAPKTVTTPAPSPPQTDVAAPSPPPHNYSRMYGNSYAYPFVPKLSDRRQGLTSRDMQPILVEYYGERAGSVRFAIYAPENVGRPIQYECPHPLTQCESDAGWTDVRPGTILEAILQDAANGYLKTPPPMPSLRLPPTRPASS